MADAIYKRTLQAVNIRRFSPDDAESFVLDQVFGIDAEITLPTLQVLSCQEKFLSHKYASFNSLTFEHMQEPTTGEEGDWFRLRADLILIAYFTEDGAAFEKWAVVDVPLLKIATLYGHVHWEDNKNQDGRARASFLWTDVAKLPAKCVLFKRGNWRAKAVAA